jgi:hypothetical protein
VPYTSYSKAKAHIALPEFTEDVEFEEELYHEPLAVEDIDVSSSWASSISCSSLTSIRRLNSYSSLNSIASFSSNSSVWWMPNPPLAQSQYVLFFYNIK